MIDIAENNGNVDVTFQNVTYRVPVQTIDLFMQQEATRVMMAAMDEDGQIDLGSPHSVTAVNHILGMCLVQRGEEFKPLADDNLAKVFDREFQKEFQKEQGDSLIDHMNTVSIILFRLIRDDEWRPEVVEPEKKPKKSAE